MIYVKCLDKFVNKSGAITHYKLMDTNRQITIVESKELKTKIRNKEWFAINLKLTSDNRLIDRSEDELESKEKEVNKSNHEKIKLKALLDKLINNTILKVLSEHEIEYELNYSSINNKASVDIRIKSFNLYYTTVGYYSGDTVTHKDIHRVITVELSKESEYIHKVIVYTSLSNTPFDQKKLPDIHHKFVIDSKDKNIKATYISDKGKHEEYCKQYNNTQETLADIDKLLSYWISKYFLSKQDNEIGRKLLDKLACKQLNKAKMLENKLYESLKNKRFNIEQAENTAGCNYNKIITVVKAKYKNTIVRIQLLQELNSYDDTKISIHFDVNKLTSIFSQEEFVNKTNKDITNIQFLEIVISFIQDYIKYSSSMEDVIIPKLKENLEEELYDKLEYNKGLVGKISDDTSELELLNDYLSNKSMKFYLRLHIEAESLITNGTDIEKDVFIGITFTDSKIIMGKANNIVLKEDYDEFRGTKRKRLHIISEMTIEKSMEDIKILLPDCNYTLNDTELQKVFNKDEVFKILGLTEVKLNVNTIKKILEIEDNDIRKYDYELDIWITKKLDIIKDAFSKIFGYTLKLDKPSIKYYDESSQQSTLSLVNLIDKASLVVAEQCNEKELLIILKNRINKCVISQTYPRVYVDDFINKVDRLNSLCDEIRQQVDDVVDLLINGKQRLEEEINNLVEFATDLCIQVDVHEETIWFMFGLHKDLVLKIENNFSRINSNIVNFKFENGTGDSYDKSVCNSVIFKLKHKLDKYKLENKFNHSMWINSTEEIIKYTLDCIDDEQLKLGLNSFDEGTDGIDEDDSTMDWI